MVEPAASLLAHVAGRARTFYVGPEEPADASSLTECHLEKAGENRYCSFTYSGLACFWMEMSGSALSTGEGKSL